MARIIAALLFLITLIVTPVAAAEKPDFSPLVGNWEIRGSRCMPCTMVVNAVRDDGTVVGKYLDGGAEIAFYAQAFKRDDSLWIEADIGSRGARIQVQLVGGQLQGTWRFDRFEIGVIYRRTGG